MTVPDTASAPGWAAVLSFIFSGVGQLYNGQIAKGLWIIFFSAVAMVVFLMGAVLLGGWLLGKVFFSGQLTVAIVLCAAGLVTSCILGIYSIMDAYRIAARK